VSTRAEVAPNPAGSWIYRPWLDLLVGCGGWSAPLLLVAAWVGVSHVHAWTFSFYLLALILNYPHFMATVYRAYHTREEFAKYRVFTLHLTLLLAATAVLTHASFRLLPWVFTLYIFWSPWHYTGQNYGLAAMFLRRSGASVTPTERRLLHWAFIASYIMLLVSFNTGPSNDPIILSLGLPAKVSSLARLLLGMAFAALGSAAYFRLVRERGLRAMAAPLTLLATQFLWFVLPTLIELGYGAPVQQTRYSSGILAVMHSAQYLWITSYYARREARVSGNSVWSMSGYFLVLLAGGIALFVPGPWLVSYIFHYDFTVSFLIFTALVNIHHFLLDGAIWKLRDTRVATVLVDRTAGATTVPREKSAAGERSAPPTGAGRWLTGRTAAAYALRVWFAALLFLWGGLDQIHYFFGTDEGNLSHLLRAAELNPYDTSLQMRIARAESQAGNLPQALDALTRAAAANPSNPAPQHARARALIQDRRYAEAYELYRQMLARFPRDPDALVNFGILAAQLGNPDEAVDSWQKALDADPMQRNAQLYLAEALERQDQPAAAARHFRAYLELLVAHPEAEHPSPGQIVSVTLELADAYAHGNQPTMALEAYQSAATLAERAHDARLESLAFAHRADLLDKNGDAAGAARSYRRGLALDAGTADPRSEAIDWFDYGQFLRRRGLPGKFPYACFVHAEEMLEPQAGSDFDAVAEIRGEMERQLGAESVAVRKNLPAVLAQTTSLPDSAFAAAPK
jgi:tetratricopeptide (TPR) repeat protein